MTLMLSKSKLRSTLKQFKVLYQSMQSHLTLNFVCLGNICRSPMAEFICKQIIKTRNINGITITSSGTSGYHDGEGMHHGTKKLLTSLSIPCDGFISKRITKQLFDESSYVIVMDDSNYSDVTRMFGSNNKIIKICDYCDLGYHQVPDP